MRYIAGASITEAVSIDAKTPHRPTPEKRVVAKFRSRPILLERMKAIIHTTGNERKTASNILGARSASDDGCEQYLGSQEYYGRLDEEFIPSRILQP